MEKKQFKKISPVPLEVPSPAVSTRKAVAAQKPTGTPPAASPFFGKSHASTLYNDSDDGVQGHYKQWTIYRDTNGPTVVTEWGKYGAKQQSTTKQFATIFEANAFISKQIAAKRAKGYRDKM